jgi:hypothetical protein
MKKEKAMQAENISNVLSAAYAQQHSGLISVECVHQRNHLEKGEVYVLAGQPVYARTGKLSGQEALNYLLNWQTIYFSFIADAPRPPANLSPRPRASPTSVLHETQPTIASRQPVARESGSKSDSMQLIPQKRDPEQHAFSLSLNHRQRLIYFLIDGQRTIADLSRCSGKTVLEVEAVLQELQQQHLIVVVTSNMHQ